MAIGVQREVTFGLGDKLLLDPWTLQKGIMHTGYYKEMPLDTHTKTILVETEAGPRCSGTPEID